MTTEQKSSVGHTAGPWGVGEGSMHVYYVNPRIEAGEDIDDPKHDSVIARCDGMGPFSGIPDDEREANTRLIAAAPETAAERDRLKLVNAELVEAANFVVNDAPEGEDARLTVEGYNKLCSAIRRTEEPSP